MYTFVGNEPTHGLFIILAQTERDFNTENVYLTNNDKIKENKIRRTK